METRYLVEGIFGSEFRAICNHCVVMAAWSRKKLKFCEKFLLFGKRPFTVKYLKFCSEIFHRDTDQRCCVQISWNLTDGKSVKSCVIYTTKKTKFRLPLKLSLLCGSRPKSARSSPTEYSRFCPNRLTVGGVIVERVNIAKWPRKVNPIFGL